MHQICLYPLDATHSEIRIFLKTLRIVVVANYLLLVLVQCSVRLCCTWTASYNSYVNGSLRSSLG